MPPFGAIASFLLTAVIWTSGFAQNIDSLMKQRVDAGETPGIVVGIYEAGKITYYTCGFANPETKEKVSQKTLFEIGSITKTFTALMTALMVQQGAWSLNDPAQKYLPPEVTLPEKNGKPITIEDLVTATSGLPRMPDNLAPADPQNPFIDYTGERMVDFLTHYTLTRESGRTYEYSNLGMALLGYVLVLKNHKTYSQLLDEWITKPLHMNQTFINPPDKTTQHRAQGYFEKTAVKAWTWTDGSVLASAEGLVSNSEDLMKYLLAQLNESPPLSQAIAMTHVPRHNAGDSHMQIGLGWHILNDEIIWHGGASGGFRSFTGFNKQTRTAVVVLTNSNTGADDLGFYLLDHSLPLKNIQMPVAPSEKTLAEFPGEYEVVPQFRILITLKNGLLFYQASGQDSFELAPESGTRFYVKETNVQIEFIWNEQQEVVKLILKDSEGIHYATRIN